MRLAVDTGLALITLVLVAWFFYALYVMPNM